MITSFFWNKVRRQRPPLQARWLLLCQFDFHQKSWSLPVIDNPREANQAIAILARGFLPLTESPATDLSDPIRGGAKPTQPAARRIRIRPRRPRGKTTTHHQTHS
jgi:hypothetical protein